MKNMLLSVLSAVLILFLFLALPIAGEEKIYDGVVRLHVKAASDSSLDQHVKIAVRDAVLSKYGTVLATFEHAEEAEDYLSSILPQVEETANAALRDAGSDGQAKVSLEKEYFDTRSYDGFTLPAGEYTSLTVTIGEGKGQNFWCILYPALCTEPAMGEQVDRADAHFNEAEYLLITRSGYALKFRSLELLSSVFGN